MAAVDFRRLERDSYRVEREPKSASIRMTPEVLGQIVVCALQVHGDGAGALTQGGFEKLLLNSSVPLPESIADILHTEPRVGGVRLEEITRMTVAPQASGIAGRMNPDNIALVAKTDLYQSLTILKRYQALFPEEVTWLTERIRGMQHAA